MVPPNSAATSLSLPGTITVHVASAASATLMAKTRAMTSMTVRPRSVAS